jgi:hypothetical protein
MVDEPFPLERPSVMERLLQRVEDDRELFFVMTIARNRHS